jgi:hypothetical protein
MFTSAGRDIGVSRGFMRRMCARQRRTAAPAADRLRREQSPLLLGPGVLAKESVECADTGLVLAQPDERTVSLQHIRAGYRQRHAGSPGVAEDELAGLDRRSLARQRLDTAALDGGLADQVLVAEWSRTCVP